MGSKPYEPLGQTIRVQSKLVEVTVVVRDAHGKPIAGLTQNDFKLYDEGKERTITFFSAEISPRATPSAAASASQPPQPTPELPLSATGNLTSAAAKPPAEQRFVALYFDDTHTQSGDLRHAQIAADHFVKEALAVDDRVAIFTMSSTVSLDFTPDVSKILEAIDKVTAHPRISEAGMGVCPRISPYQAYVIVSHLDPMAYDAAVAEAYKCNCVDADNITIQCRKEQYMIVRAQADQTWGHARMLSQNTLATIEGVVNYLAKMPGKRTLILASSGFLAGTLEPDQDKIIAEALHAGVVINALDAKGLYAEAPGRPFNERQDILPLTSFVFETISLGNRLATVDDALANFAASTGGLFFHNRNDLDFGFRELGMTPEFSYVLGFSPDDVKLDGKYHVLKVKVTAPDYHFIQARPGYFAPSEESAPAVAAAGREERLIDKEVQALDSLSELPAVVSADRTRSQRGAGSLAVTMHLNAAALPFQVQPHLHLQKLTFVAALFDDHDRFISGKEAYMDLALKDATLAEYLKSGFTAKMNVDAPSDTAYRLRVVIQTENPLKTFTTSVAIPPSAENPQPTKERGENRPGSFIEGTIRDVDGNPWVGVVLRFYTDSYSIEATVKTDQDGKYRVELPVGTHVMTAIYGAATLATRAVPVYANMQTLGDINFRYASDAYHQMKTHYEAGQKALKEADATLRDELDETSPQQQARLQAKGNTVAAKAIAEFQKSLEGADLNDSFFDRFAVLSALAEAYDVGGQHKEAVEEYQQTLALREDAAVYDGLGNALAKMGDLAGAAAAYQRSIDLDPSQAARAYRDLGISLYNADRFDEALAPLRASVGLDATSSQGWYVLGATLVGILVRRPETNDDSNAQSNPEKIYQEALDAYKKCIELDSAGEWRRKAEAGMNQLRDLPGHTAQR